MNKYTLLLVLFLGFFAGNSFAQTSNFEDGFEDGDFSSNPTWSGDTGDFIVVNGSPNHLLQLQGDSDNGGVAYLSTPSANATGSWEFYINQDFNPSDGNHADIFLMSDIADLEGSVNGYALRAGENGGSDVFKIVRYDGGTEAATVLTGTTDISSGGAFRVKVTRQSGGNWNLRVASSYGGPLSPEGGTQTDNTYTTTAYFGVRATYSSTRFDKFFFDFKIDLPPFSLTSAAASGNQVDVTFNRAYKQPTVQAGDFSIDNGIGSPNSIGFPSATEVRLTYNNPLPSNKYTLTVQNIDDQNGNTIPASTKNFSIYGNYAAGDIIINEIMYDPPGALEEYIELKNTSSKYLNLANWEIGDDTGTDYLGSSPITIEPDSFLVISTDTTALNARFGNRSYFKFNSLASFNNGGDAVQLITGAGALADSLTYTSGWGGNNVAIERRSDTAPSTLKANWGDSPNPGGGTPGISNQIAADNTAPSLLSLRILDNSTVELIFSEAISSSTATNQSNYQISPPAGIQLISSRSDTVQLFLSQPLQSGQTYDITVQNLNDIFGNTISPTTQQATYVEFSAARPGDAVINEILYTRENAGDPEFVELYNGTNKNFDLSDWTISDASNTVGINPGTQLVSGGYLVITDNPALAASVDNGLYLPDFPSLNDNGDAVYIQDGSGTVIDSLFYTTAYGGQPDGTSAERIDPKAASNDPANFSSSTADEGSTPGAKNSVFKPDKTSPQLTFARFISAGNIEVRFSEFIQQSAGLEFSLNDASLPVNSFNSKEANRIVLNTLGNVEGGTELVITAKNLKDIKGNTTNSSQIAVAQKPAPEDVVINEIMYNPLSESDDNRPDQSEYLEIRNIRDYAISLEGITLHDEPDENGEVRSLIPVSTHSKWIPAKGTALIYADEALSFKKSQTAIFFDLNNVPDNILLRMDRSSLSLASSGDAVYLSDSTGANIDSVFYDESWQNPNLIDDRGIALERISPTGKSNDASNWGSSVNPKGGTPGKENSIFQNNTKTPSKSGITFSPNPFSPDDDGYQDNLFINYKLGKPDYLLKVRIYDRYGRLVKTLADGKQAGFKGSLIWNGRKDDGSRNRIGIYIVVFEAYDSENGQDRSFKKTVVLARKLN